ncbi:unnamed protein product [Effrenium voratum]|uniref:Uncharacterized protein n=1 Tax=Effrenium voratum TaxID=2562239 RepID=A0AA36HXT2_9DINO|nr:unnamed protein product [Effrenium voratum]
MRAIPRANWVQSETGARCVWHKAFQTAGRSPQGWADGLHSLRYPFPTAACVGERDGSDLTHHFPFLAITLVRGLDLVNIFLHPLHLRPFRTTLGSDSDATLHAATCNKVRAPLATKLCGRGPAELLPTSSEVAFQDLLKTCRKDTHYLPAFFTSGSGLAICGLPASWLGSGLLLSGPSHVSTASISSQSPSILLFGQWQWQRQWQWKLWPTMSVGTWLVSGPAARWTKLRHVSLLGQSPCSRSQMVLDTWHALDGSDDAALNPVLQPSFFACDKAWEPLLAAPWEPVELSPESQSAFRGLRRALLKAEASVQSFRADVARCSSFDHSCCRNPAEVCA